MRVAEEFTPIGLAVVRGELLEVSGRPGSLDGLWLRRIWPAPSLEYGVVRFPLSPRPLHSASMWTAQWPLEHRSELAFHAAAVYRDWIACDCPERVSLEAAPGLAVVV